MTQIILRFLFVCALFCSAWAEQLQAQASQVPVGCAQQQGPIFANQDCQGAAWITRTRTVADVSALRGPGCIARELPAWQNTCLTSNERRTLWYMLEVQPLPGGSTAVGSSAGYLRLRITPGDVDGRAVRDSGTQFLGNTDYDFALFRVSDAADRADACQAVKNATLATEAGSIQAACNYSGIAGPTGMADQGQGVSVDDQRYCRPVAVRVGEVYILAIDNFSLNASYFVLDFGVPTADPTRPTAQVVPDTALAIDATPTLQMGAACGYGVVLSTHYPLPVDSVRAGMFRLTIGTQQLAPTAITPIAHDRLRGTATRFLLMYGERLPYGTAALEEIGTLEDRYGRAYGTFILLAASRPPVRLSQLGDACASAKVRLSAQRGYGTRFAGWSFGSLAAMAGYVDSAQAQLALPTQAGNYVVYYRYMTLDGCLDSVSISVYVSARPGEVRILQPAPGVLEAQMSGAAQAGIGYEWRLADSLFSAPARLQVPAAGVYRVRATHAGCPGLWSNEVAVAAITAANKVLAGQALLRLYPNPAQGVVSLYVEGLTSGEMGVKIISSAGVVVWARTFSNPDWHRQISLDGIATGLYTVQVSLPGLAATERLVVE